jgi:hypothetical protein
MFSAFTPSVSPVGARGRASFVRQLGQKKIFFIEMGATCAGHVTEKTLTAPAKSGRQPDEGQRQALCLLRKTDGNNLRQLPLGGSRFPNDILRPRPLFRGCRFC